MGDLLSFDPALLMLSLVPSGVGFVLFVYGKKLGRPPQLVAGLLLMISPYFTDTLVSMTLVGVAIGAALWVALRMDYMTAVSPASRTAKPPERGTPPPARP